jgi:hypothetical protein
MKVIISLFILFSSYLYAQIGNVVKIEGIVKVKQKDSIKKVKLKSGYVIKEGDIISTYRNAVAVLKLEDGSDIVLSQKSTISFLAENEVEQNDGKIYYKITSRDIKNRLNIKTNFAIIGIKGTTFIINSSKKDSFVALKEGKIGIKSIKEEFKLYKQKVLDEFQKYLALQQSEFEKFKQNAGVEEFVGIKKEFDLDEGKVVSFEGDKAVEKDLDTQKEFIDFEKLLDF